MPVVLLSSLTLSLSAGLTGTRHLLHEFCGLAGKLQIDLGIPRYECVAFSAAVVFVFTAVSALRCFCQLTLCCIERIHFVKKNYAETEKKASVSCAH